MNSYGLPEPNLPETGIDNEEYAEYEAELRQLYSRESDRKSEGEGDEKDGNNSYDESGNSEDEVIETSSQQETEAPKKTIRSETDKVRGLTRLKKLLRNWDGKKREIRLDVHGRFKGKYKSQIASHMGVILRRDVGLKHLNWKKVPPALKDKLWEELLRFYDIEETMRRRIMIYFDEHLRNFRRKLFVKFALPYLDKPAKLKSIPKQYRVYLNQEEWDNFIKWRLYVPCKELSEMGVEARANHKYDHRMGRAEYAGLLEKLEGFDKKLEDGTLKKEPGSDSVTLVFGKERGGRVSFAGKGVTPTNYWHLPRKGVVKECVVELKKQLDDERHMNQMEKEKKDEQMKEMMAKMNKQTKLMNNLMSQLKSQGLFEKKTANSKKARKSSKANHSVPATTLGSPEFGQYSKGFRPRSLPTKGSPIREKSVTPESHVRHNSPTTGQEVDTTKQKSLASNISPPNLNTHLNRQHLKTNLNFQ